MVIIIHLDTHFIIKKDEFVVDVVVGVKVKFSLI